jgi:hypothetical protein
MALHPQMWALRRKQNHQLGLLVREFIQQHPTIDPELDNWTAGQEQAWREFTGDFSCSCSPGRWSWVVRWRQRT